MVPAHGTPGVFPDGQSCWDAAVAAVSWFHQGAIAPRTPHPASFARNKSWPKWSRSPSVPSPWSEWAGSPQVPINPSVFPDSQVIPECLVLQYFHIHRSYQNAWSLSISRFTGHTRMPGPSVFPDSQVIPECLVLQYFQTHRSYQNAWSSDAQKYKFRHSTQAI